MRVVDEHRERLPASTGSKRRARGPRRRGPPPRPPPARRGRRSRDRGQGVLDVEVTGERSRTSASPPGVDAAKRDRRRRRTRPRRAIVGRVGARRENVAAGARRPRRGRRRCARRTGRPRSRRRPPASLAPRRARTRALGPEVVLHVAVEVEMVLGQVREHRDREADAVRSAQDERVRGDLHRARRYRRRRASAGRSPAGRSPRASSARPPPRCRRRCSSRSPGARSESRRLEDVTNQEGRRRLAVGAGDARDPRGWRSDRPRTAAIGAIAARASGTVTWGTGSSSRRSTTSAAAPRSTAEGAKSCPSARCAADAEEERSPGATRQLS